MYLCISMIMSDAIELAIAMADTENGIVEETWELTNDLNDLYSKYFFATSLLVNLFILFITENPCFTDIYVIIVKLNTHCTMNTSHIRQRKQDRKPDTCSKATIFLKHSFGLSRFRLWATIIMPFYFLKYLFKYL